MRLFLYLLPFISSLCFAQNLDRNRLHEELSLITNNKSTKTDQSTTSSSDLASKKKVVIKRNLEDLFFKDSVQSKRAAPKRKRTR